MAFLSAYRCINTENLILRPIEVTDAPAIFQYTSDPRVARFTHWNTHTNLNQTIRYIHNIQHLHNTQVWGIQLPTSNTIIGECSITQHADGRAELYYALAYNQWGKGYTTQALTALLSVAQEIPAIGRLEAWIIRENSASCRVAQKAGLQLERTIDHAWIIDHTAHDIALYTK